jgi:phosphorylcholine metabolism protein LicD
MALAIYIKKYIKAKEELWKLKYFTMQKYNLQKKSSKINQNPSRYKNSIINQSQVSTQAKISAFKNPHIKIYRPIIT